MSVQVFHIFEIHDIVQVELRHCLDAYQRRENCFHHKGPAVRDTRTDLETMHLRHLDDWRAMGGRDDYLDVNRVNVPLVLFGAASADGGGAC